MLLKDSVFVVTGGASGLGEAVVRKCTELGGKAAIFDLNKEAGEKLAEELKSRAWFMEANVTSETSVKEALDKTIDTFGGIHVLVNCAGIGLPKKVLGRKGVHLLDSFREVVEVNLVGTFNVLRLAAEKMSANEPDEEGERGVIINTASVAAFEGQVGQASYSASKGGVASMTLPVARELAEHGIRVVTIAPGVFDTPMFKHLPEEVRKRLEEETPFPGRLGNPSEYAHLVKSIVENPMINGTTFRLDGAIRMPPG